jgi:hypothetical protein
MLSVTHRALHEKVHIINYVTGESLSLDAATGWFILNNLGRIQSLGLDNVTASFFFKEDGLPNLEVCRPALASMEATYGFPTVVAIELNETCTPECMSGERRCYLHQYKADHGDSNVFETMTNAEIQALFSNFVELGTFGLIFKGGEPFASPRFDQILDIAAHVGLVSEIYSPLQVYPKWFVNKSPYERLASIRTVMWSKDPAVFDQMVGTPGAGEKFLSSFEELTNAMYHLNVVFPQLDQNYSSWKEVRDLCKVNGFPFRLVRATEQAIQDNDQLNVGLDEQQMHYFCAYHENWLGYPDTENKLPASFQIWANGDVSSCAHDSAMVGNIRQALPSKIFQSSEARAGMPFFFEKSLLQGMHYSITDPVAKQEKHKSLIHR